MWTHPRDIEEDVCAVWQRLAAGAVDLGNDALSFLGEELLIRLNLPPYCRPSELPLPLIPFRERTEAWRIDVNTCALTHTHDLNCVLWQILPCLPVNSMKKRVFGR